MVVVATDLAVEQEVAERLPAVQAVVDRTRDTAAVGDALAFSL